MKGENVQPLAKRWQDGVRLLHSGKPAGQFITQEVAWTTGALEDAEPWPALHARLEPLGELHPEEQRILMGMSTQGADHATSLICLAVRLHRIAAWLDSMATVGASGPPKFDMGPQITLARSLWNDGDNGITLAEAARQAVDKAGHGSCASKKAAFQYVRKKISDLPVRFG